MAKNDNELRIRNVNPKVLQDLDNIAGNLGIAKGSYLKTKLSEIVEAAPSNLKQPPKKY